MRKDWDRTTKELPCPICDKTHGCLYAKDHSAVLCARPITKLTNQNPDHIAFCKVHFKKELDCGLRLYWMTKKWKDYHTKQTKEDIESGRIKIPRVIPELEIIKASDIQAKPVQWFWRDRIPAGMVTLIFGNSEAGKSIMISDTAARTTRIKSKWSDGAICKAGSILIFSSEEDKERTLVPRLKAMGAVMSRVTFAKGIIEENEEKSWFDIKRNLPSLEQHLKKNRQIRLVIIDPVTAYLSRRGKDENLEIRNALAPLEELAEKYRVTMILVTHMNKRIDASAPTLHRAIGSVAYGAVVRAAWVILRDPEDEERRLFLKAKLSIGVAQLGLAFRIKQTGEWSSQVIVDWEDGFVAESADEILSHRIGRPSVKAQRAEELILEALESGPVKVSEMEKIADEEEISWKTFTKAKRGLGVLSVRYQNKKTGEWYGIWKRKKAI